MVLRLISCSPRRPGLFATVAGGIASADLTPASGRQDHTTSPSASAPFVKGAARVHRIPPHVYDDRETPLREAGPNRFIPVSSPPPSGISEIQKFSRSGLYSRTPEIARRANHQDQANGPHERRS